MRHVDRPLGVRQVLGWPLVALALLAVAGSSYAAQPKAIAQVAHAPGVMEGETWKSDVTVFNPNDETKEIHASFVPRKGSPSNPYQYGVPDSFVFTLAPYEQRTFVDILWADDGFNMDADGLELASGSLILETAGHPIDAQSVVYSERPDSDFGMFLEGVTADDATAAGGKAYTLGSADATLYRENNLGIAFADGTSVALRAYKHGVQRGRTLYFQLDQYQSDQKNDIFDKLGIPPEEGLLFEYEVNGGAFYPFGSVVDGIGPEYEGTSDPTSVPALDPSETLDLNGLGRIQGYQLWRHYVVIGNPSEETAAVTVDVIPRDDFVPPGGTAGEPIGTFSFSLPANDTLVIDDIFAEIGLPDDQDMVARLHIESDEPLIASGRSYALLDDGTAGQTIPGQTEAQFLEPGRTYNFVGLQEYSSGMDLIAYVNMLLSNMSEEIMYCNIDVFGNDTQHHRLAAFHPWEGDAWTRMFARTVGVMDSDEYGQIRIDCDRSAFVVVSQVASGDSNTVPGQPEPTAVPVIAGLDLTGDDIADVVDVVPPFGLLDSVIVANCTFPIPYEHKIILTEPCDTCYYEISRIMPLPPGLGFDEGRGIIQYDPPCSSAGSTQTVVVRAVNTAGAGDWMHIDYRIDD